MILILILVSLGFFLYFCYKHIENNNQNDLNNNQNNNNQNESSGNVNQNESSGNVNQNESSGNVMELFTSSAVPVETGHCYQPDINDANHTFDLDTTMIKQMSTVNDPEQFLTLVNDMKQRYQAKLYQTIDDLYNEQNNVTKDLNETTRTFNQYGLETLSKQYYDTIFKHGDFEEVKDLIILPEEKITSNSIENNEGRIINP